MSQIQQLIIEGEQVRKKSYKAIPNKSGCLSGEDYTAWIEKCKIALDNYCNNEDVKASFKEFSNNAYRDSLSSYEKMIGVLKAVESSDYIINDNSEKSKKNKKIFISHCSKNQEITNKFVAVLKRLGINDNQIYYSSFVETGAKYLDDCFESITREFNNNRLMVIFMLSREFYKSNVCLAEMGATWVTNPNYMPIILPPLGYDDIKGVLKSTQNGILLTACDISEKLDGLKELIEEYFKIDKTLSLPEWTREKEEFINVVNEVEKNIKAIEENIKDIKIQEEMIVLKVSIQNNTKLRYECESLEVHLKIKDGKDVIKKIEDWSVNSIVIQSLEEITFFVSLKSEQQIKRSQIIVEESKIQLCYFHSS